MQHKTDSPEPSIRGAPSRFVPDTQVLTAPKRLKSSEFLIRSDGMRNSHRNAKESFSKDLWYQARLSTERLRASQSRLEMPSSSATRQIMFSSNSVTVPSA